MQSGVPRWRLSASALDSVLGSHKNGRSEIQAMDWVHIYPNCRGAAQVSRPLLTSDAISRASRSFLGEPVLAHLEALYLKLTMYVCKM